MKYAIIESGGKQYKAEEGATIHVDRLNLEPGTEVNITEVLLISDDGNVTVGTPLVDGAVVKVTVIEEFRGAKVIIFKYHPKKRYRLKKGHRQWHTSLHIDSIQTK